MTAVISIGGLAVRSGRIDISRLLPYPTAERELEPAEQISLASFQAGARECRPVAAVTGIHEGIDLDVLIDVRRPVRDDCEITMEVINDRTGRALTGRRMTCRIPLQALAEGRQPAGQFEDYCTGSLVDALQDVFEEGR
jgi:hypothetical protein